MLSAEGFEVIQSVGCSLFQVIDVFGPGHVILKSESQECGFFAEVDGLIVVGEVEVWLQVWVFSEDNTLCFGGIDFYSP